MLEKAKVYLQSHFGYSSFRSGQEEAITSVLEGNDVVCVMPTGGGKSICYQIPALVLDGTTIVVSPLISLMKDQVDALTQAGIAATYINSSISVSEANDRIFEAMNGSYKLLYIAPERLGSYDFLEKIKKMRIPLIAIDEAHCISQWGHDFRPSYLHIEKMIEQLPQRPRVIALTATATPLVREDICKSLHIDNKNTIITGFERKNLSFKVIKGQDRYAYLRNYVRNNKKEAGIIYGATRKTVDQLYQKLREENIEVGRYHAGMGEKDRAEEQDKFLQDQTNVMVATSAFGMGIDKSNIHYVIHYQLPKNMESYYQEAGRAGRDGLESECIVLYSPQDVQVQRFLIDQSADRTRIATELEKLQAMIDYCHTEECLQGHILQYFGEQEIIPCGRCENCLDSRSSVEVTTDAQKVLSCIIRMGQRFGKSVVAQVLTGSKNKKMTQLNFEQLPTYGILKEKSAREVSEFIEFLITQELIGIEQGTFPTIYVTAKGKEVLLGHKSIYRKELMEAEKKISADDPLFDELRKTRKTIAENEKVPPFVIFSDSSLKDMCVTLPQTEDEFLQVSGVGEHKLNKYGEAFIRKIIEYCQQHPEKRSDVSGETSKKTSKKAEKNSHLISMEMFNSGLTVDEIAKSRELSTTTIENHLIQCKELGYRIDFSDILLDPYIPLIKKAVEEAGREKLKPIKELLPTEISYFMIKIYLLKDKAGQEG